MMNGSLPVIVANEPAQADIQPPFILFHSFSGVNGFSPESSGVAGAHRRPRTF